MTDQFPVNSGNVRPPLAGPPLPPTASQSTVTLYSAAGPGMRRKKRALPQQNLRLERILGLTTASSNILATAESHDLIAYAAGAVVVLYNHKRNKQVGFLYPPTQNTSSNNAVNSHVAAVAAAAGASSGNIAAASGVNMMSNGAFISPLGSSQGEMASLPGPKGDEKKKTHASTRAKPISCLAFSPDGNYLAAGEMGHQPRILIWDIRERVLLHECRGHKFGVLSLSFSPNMRYLVSVGFQHDGYLYVWHWRKGIKVAGNKVTSKVNALSFSSDGTFFVTAGLRHVKFWYFDNRGRVQRKGNLSSRETQVLDGRSGLLGALRHSNFIAVGCDKGTSGHVYFLTDNGILCMFKEGRVIDKWVDLQVRTAHSIAVSLSYIICACSGGVIRLFEPGTLQYCGMLPKPHPLGVDITSITSPNMIQHNDDNTFYPDAIAVAYDESTGKLTAVYADRSLYVWDIRDLKKIGKFRSFISHSDCVWGVEPYPNIPGKSIPMFSFATHSADGTVRFWNLDYTLNPTASSTINNTPSNGINSPASPDIKSPSSSIPSLSSSTSSFTSSSHRRNIYSRELIKMLYVDPDAADFSKFRRDVDIADEQLPDFGIRSIKISSDGKYLATGDRSGNLRVHDMDTWEQITYQEAHDSEILSLDLTDPKTEGAPYLVATASRDRLLHVFDINQNFELLQTLDDHSSSITAVRFSRDAAKLVSCGADKGVIFRSLEKGDTQCYTTYHNYSGRSTVFDMSMDINERYVATVTGERRLLVFNIDSGKPVRVCKPETTEEATNGAFIGNSGGSLINIDLDPFSGTFAVTSGSDRTIRLFDLTSGTCIDKVNAHAELITSVKFIKTSTNGVRVVSTCSDGTVFIWKVSSDIVTKMMARSGEQEQKATQMVIQGKSAPDDVQEDKRLALLRGKNRFRRLSTATSVRPTPTVSQLARQGERRTFSTMSPAEQKYDDLYKNIANRRNGINTAPPSPVTAAPGSAAAATTTTRPQLKLPPKREGNSGRKTPEGKLERLYNGLPTSGARERTNSQLTASRYHLDAQRPTGLNALRQGTPPSARMNPVIRRQMSREGLGKKDHLSQLKENRMRPRSDGGLRHKPSEVNNSRRASVPEAETLTSEAPRPSSQPKDVEEEDSDIDHPHGQTADNSFDDDGQEAEDERDEDEEEDDDGGEEEQVIFISPSPEQDDIGKPFEVTSHEVSEDSGSADNEGEQKSPSLSDDEKNHSGSAEGNAEEDEESDEDALIETIASREAPRMTPSLSRTTSMSISSRKKTEHEELKEDKEDLPLAKDTPAFRELQKKLEKAKKRQSLTARYLSSLGDKRFRSRESLDTILGSFQELARQMQDRADENVQTTIPVALPNVPNEERNIPSPEEPKEPPSNDPEPKTTTTPSASESDTKTDEEDYSHVLSDLDGAIILLDSVLDAIDSFKDKPHIMTNVESKLTEITTKVHQKLKKPETDPATLTLLDKYSSMLVQMVENRMSNT